MFVNRGEALKKRSPPTRARPSSPPTPKRLPPLGFNAFADEDEQKKPSSARSIQQMSTSSGGGGTGAGGRRGPINVGPSSYSKDEIDVIR